MKYLKLLTLSLFFIANAHAADEPASAASIKKLLAITQVAKLVDMMPGQIDDMIKPAMNQALDGQPMNAKQHEIMDGMSAKLTALLKKEMSWEILEPTFVDIYRQALTEQEVQGMIAFYQTPAGKAVVEKMPRIMQASLQFTQSSMTSLMPKIQQLVSDTIEQLEAAADK
jgi:hypothetical protein